MCKGAGDNVGPSNKRNQGSRWSGPVRSSGIPALPLVYTRLLIDLSPGAFGKLQEDYNYWTPLNGTWNCINEDLNKLLPFTLVCFCADVSVQVYESYWTV